MLYSEIQIPEISYYKFNTFSAANFVLLYALLSNLQNSLLYSEIQIPEISLHNICVALVQIQMIVSRDFLQRIEYILSTYSNPPLQDFDQIEKELF